MIDIVRDVERYAPHAVLLNYTNPMAMLCRLLQSQTKVTLTSLCHSVQKTAMMLSDWIGAPYEEVDYLCAEINHQAHYLKFEWNGVDAYPLIHEAITKREEIYMEEIVRNGMSLALEYYVTGSSAHNLEYNPWFRKRQDLIEKYYLPGTGWHLDTYAFFLQEYLSRENGKWQKNLSEWMQKPADLARGEEYASGIFNAVFGNHMPFSSMGIFLITASLTIYRLVVR